MHVRAHAALVACAEIGSQILLVRPDPVSRGPYLSLVGQEVAPGRCRLVAVASSGLYPLPLWISAAGQRQMRTYRANGISRSVGSLVSRNKALLSFGQLNCAYGDFRFASEVRVSASTAREKRLAHDADGKVGKHLPGVAHQNRASVAMHKHPETLKPREVHDDAQVLGNVDRA